MAKKMRTKLKATTPPVDVRVTRNGSTVSFALETQTAKDWVKRNVKTESWQFLGQTLVVGVRSAEFLLQGMALAGLKFG